MPQVLKEEIRHRIVTAALEVFAEQGFEGASMAAIAERAGLGTATTYRYYAGKAELFEAAVPQDLARRFEAILERRVKGLARVALGVTPPGEGDTSEEMLRFWVEHRLAVVVLLDRAEGTPYAQYGERFVWLLVTATLAQIRSERPGIKVSPPARFVLQRIFENTRRMLAAILVEHATERALREAIEVYWSYQIPGLRGYAQWVLAHDRAR